MRTRISLGGAIILSITHAGEAGPARLIAGNSGLKEVAFGGHSRRASGLTVTWAHRSVKQLEKCDLPCVEPQCWTQWERATSSGNPETHGLWVVPDKCC